MTIRESEEVREEKKRKKERKTEKLALRPDTITVTAWACMC